MTYAAAFLLLAFAWAPAAAIRDVDFRNATYRPTCNNRNAVTVANGVFERNGSPEDRIWFKVMSIEYGDLTGDGKEEAVVLTACALGGTGSPTEGFVYAMQDGQPRLIARVPAGDRAMGGIRSLTIEGALLKVTREQGTAACCPETLDTTLYKVRNGKLIQVGVVLKEKIQ